MNKEEIRPATGVMFLYKPDSKWDKRRVLGIVEWTDNDRARVALVGQAAGPISVTLPLDSLHERHEMPDVRITSLYMSEPEERFMCASFGVGGSCGCDGAFDDGCPLCSEDKRGSWLRAIRKAQVAHT